MILLLILLLLLIIFFGAGIAISPLFFVICLLVLGMLLIGGARS